MGFRRSRNSTRGRDGLEGRATATGDGGGRGGFGRLLLRRRPTAGVAAAAAAAAAAAPDQPQFVGGHDAAPVPLQLHGGLRAAAAAAAADGGDGFAQ